MAYSLSNICTKITGIGQVLLKLSLVVVLYTFLKHSVYLSHTSYGYLCSKPYYVFIKKVQKIK